MRLGKPDTARCRQNAGGNDTVLYGGVVNIIMLLYATPNAVAVVRLLSSFCAKVVGATSSKAVAVTG